MAEIVNSKPVAHVVSVAMIEEERAMCQKELIAQYDDMKIDEKKLAAKLKDLRSHSDAAKSAIAKVRELADTY